jgi:hypothetical protein
LSAQLFYEFAVVLGRYNGELSFGIGVGHVAGSSLGNVPTIIVDADSGEILDEFRNPISAEVEEEELTL